MNRLAPLRSSRGFTLVEVMVAMAVLALMMAGIATIISFVSKTWLAGINIVDNFTKARVMLNLLDRDIQMMVMRRDVCAFVDYNGNPACAFYTKVQGNQGTTTTDPRALSLVQYVLNPVSSPTTSSALDRIELGLYYANGTMALSYPLPTLHTLPTNIFGSSTAAQQTEEIGSGVIAFQWQFIDGTGAIQNPISNATAYNFDFTALSASSNYRAVIVSLVVMSNNAYKAAISTGNLSNVAGCFVNSTSGPAPVAQTYAQVWNAFLNNPSSTYLSLPAPLRSNGSILVFQRYIPLPMTAPSSS